MTHPRPVGRETPTFDLRSRHVASGNTVRRMLHGDVANKALTRRYHIRYLDGVTGECKSLVHVAPAVPVFENTCAAIARGTLLATPNGYVAIEDLEPGMLLQTADNGPQPVQWIGSITLVPHLPRHGRTICSLLRILAEGFGLGRPAPDLLLAPGARLLHRSFEGEGEVLSPAEHYCDGESVIRVMPQAPITVYHLAFRSHQIILANGLEIESMLPERDVETVLNAGFLAAFRGLFPNLKGLDAFGEAARPRISLGEGHELFQPA